MGAPSNSANNSLKFPNPSVLTPEDLPALIATSMNTFKIVSMTDDVYTTNTGINIKKSDCEYYDNNHEDFYGYNLSIDKATLDMLDLSKNEITAENFPMRFNDSGPVIPDFPILDYTDKRCTSIMYNNTLNITTLLTTRSEDGKYYAGVEFGNFIQSVMSGGETEMSLNTYDSNTINQQDVEFYDLIGLFMYLMSQS